MIGMVDFDGSLDLLPEHCDFRDEGCELFPSCLNCPLPRCIYEQPRGRQRLRMSARAEMMTELRWQGKGSQEIASMFGVSLRTVQRALRSCEPGPSPVSDQSSDENDKLRSCCPQPQTGLRND